jgi:hypothetical protein
LRFAGLCGSLFLRALVFVGVYFSEPRCFGRIGHARPNFVGREIRRTLEAALRALQFRRELLPAEVVVEMPGSGLGCAVFQFAAAKRLQKFNDRRIIGDRIGRHHFVRSGGGWFAEAMFEADDCDVDLLGLLRRDAEETATTTAATAAADTAAATAANLLLLPAAATAAGPTTAAASTAATATISTAGAAELGSYGNARECFG